MAENNSNSSTMMITAAVPAVGRDYPFIKGFKVVTASFSAMQIATALIKTHVPIEYYLAAAMLVVAFALMLIAKFVPPPPGGESNTLAIVVDQMGVFLAVTSLFFSFSIFLPPFISIVLLYWGAYMAMIIVIVCCFYCGSNQPHGASISGIDLV